MEIAPETQGGGDYRTHNMQKHEFIPKGNAN